MDWVGPRGIGAREVHYLGFTFGLISIFLQSILEKMSKISVVNHRDEFISNMMAMLTRGTSNDVKLVLSDGAILANKDVLSAQSEYFATMFSNNKVKFIEGETNTVKFPHCSKNIMEKIVKYLFSGEMKLQDMSFSDLVTMMNMTTMMMLVALKDDIQKHLLEIIPRSGEDWNSFPELVKSLMLAEQLKLDAIKTALVRELYKGLDSQSHRFEDIDSVCEAAMKQLSSNLLKEILLYGKTKKSENDDKADWRTPSTKNLFDAFVLWLSENDCTDEDKKEVTDSFDFDDFDEQELLMDVRKSGLYSTEKIDRRALDIFESQDKIIADLKRDLRGRDADFASKSMFQTWKIFELTQEIKMLKNKYKEC